MISVDQANFQLVLSRPVDVPAWPVVGWQKKHEPPMAPVKPVAKSRRQLTLDFSTHRTTETPQKTTPSAPIKAKRNRSNSFNGSGSGTTGKPKRPKGLKGVWRAQDAFSDQLGVSCEFEVPEPIVHNQYWVYLPLPRKQLFKDLLNLPPQTPAPDPVDHVDPPTFSSDRPTANLNSSYGDNDVHNQVQLLQHAGEIYRWTKEKDAKEAALKAHQRVENERKANILARAQKSVVSHRKYVNTVEKCVFEVEIDRAIEASGLTPDGGIPSDEVVEYMSPVRQRRVKLLKSRVDQTLKHVEKASHIKACITQRDRVITNLVKPLRSHLPAKKGKYERSGQFTKEQRQKRGATARPYRKTGKHIHDFQNPRNAKQRDVQLAERAKKLGVHPDVLRKSLTGK